MGFSSLDLRSSWVGRTWIGSAFVQKETLLDQHDWLNLESYHYFRHMRST
ncbi:MAG TPA: hypothetical protein PK208_01130 [Fibrobacteria bacterium]|nr:hypothetical protein [Fibrobacteria bacterium]